MELETVLFYIFSGNGHAQFKLPEHLWAVTEALNRVKLSAKPLWHWDVIKAGKEHKCWFGCSIKRGEEYYTPGKYTSDEDIHRALSAVPLLRRNLPVPLHLPGKRDAVKLCVRCEATLWREGDRGWSLWGIRKANEDHECSRGCPISAGDFYFIWTGQQSDGMKMCAKCMAMVLYFKHVDNLPAYRYSAWDWKRQEPLRIERPPYTGMLDGYWLGCSNKETVTYF